MQVVEAPVASRTDGFAELRRHLNAEDADIVVVNKRLDEAQGMYIRLISKTFKRSMVLVSIICCYFRWSYCCGDPSG